MSLCGKFNLYLDEISIDYDSFLSNNEDVSKSIFDYNRLLEYFILFYKDESFTEEDFEILCSLYPNLNIINDMLLEKFDITKLNNNIEYINTDDEDICTSEEELEPEEEINTIESKTNDLIDILDMPTQITTFIETKEKSTDELFNMILENLNMDIDNVCNQIVFIRSYLKGKLPDNIYESLTNEVFTKDESFTRKLYNTCKIHDKKNRKFNIHITGIIIRIVCMFLEKGGDYIFEYNYFKGFINMASCLTPDSIERELPELSNKIKSLTDNISTSTIYLELFTFLAFKFWENYTESLTIEK